MSKFETRLAQIVATETSLRQLQYETRMTIEAINQIKRISHALGLAQGLRMASREVKINQDGFSK
jgi:hypothetical protein